MMTNDNAKQRCPKCGAVVPVDAPQGLCPQCVLGGAMAPTGGGIAATATAEIPSLERVAKAFPQLEVRELVGRGGMGFVYKARQPHLDRWVALKLLPDKLAQDPQFAERFHREGRVLAKLNHPNIVSVFDFGQAGGFYFLLMEYVDGVNLRQAMQAGRFSPTEALQIVPKICEALQYAHEQGVLHRDIKPENILLDAKGRVKIADFGIAKLVGEERPAVTLTGTGATLGTPHYMAPEQLESPTKVDHRADIYSLGVVFYEMLTGELPIGRFEPPSARTPVSPTVDEVVFRTLEKNRDKRFQSAGEVKTRVEQLSMAGGGPPPVIAAPAPAVARLSIKAVIAAALTGLAVLICGMLLLLVLLHGGSQGTWRKLLLFMMPAGFFGLLGTLLGWVALSEIRAQAGRLRGVPLAVFAALACPLLLLLAVTLGVPLLVAVPGRPGLLVRLLALLVPAGALTFSVWSIYAAANWAAHRPPTARRGVLKWIFLVVCLAGTGWALSHGWLASSGRMRPNQNPLVGGAPLLPAGKVELVALTHNPPDGITWKPDGTLGEPREVRDPFVNVKSPGEERSVQMEFALPDLANEDSSPKFVVPQATSWATATRARRRRNRFKPPSFWRPSILPRCSRRPYMSAWPAAPGIR